jgi:hypothetical protein
VIDGLVGTVPMLGDLFDTTWKANSRNVRLLETHLQTVSDVPPRRVNRGFVILVLLAIALVLLSLIALGIFVFSWVWQRLSS